MTMGAGYSHANVAWKRVEDVLNSAGQRPILKELWGKILPAFKVTHIVMRN